VIHRRWEQLTAVAGTVSVVLIVVALFTWGNQAYTDPLGKTLTHYVKHQNLALASAFIFVCWGVVTLIFAAGLRSILEHAEGEVHILSTLAYTAAVLNAVWMMVWASANGALVAIASQASHSEIKLLLALVSYVDNLNFLAPGLFVGAAALAMLRGGVFARWLAWLGLISGGLSLISGASYLDPNPNGAVAGLGNLSMLGLLLLLIWTIAIGVSLLRRSPLATHSREVSIQAERVPV
jgi:hypothetical protein